MSFLVWVKVLFMLCYLQTTGRKLSAEACRNRWAQGRLSAFCRKRQFLSAFSPIRTGSVHFEVCSGFCGNKNAPDVSIEGEWSRCENFIATPCCFAELAGKTNKTFAGSRFFHPDLAPHKSGLYRRNRNLTGLSPQTKKACGVAVSQRKLITAGGEFHPALKQNQL